MECTLAIRGIANSRVLREFEDIFSKLAGAEFSFIDLKGKPVISPKVIGATCKSILSSKKKAVFLTLLEKSCDTIIATKRPCIYNHDRATFILIPIAIKERVIGAVLVCPKAGEKSANAILSDQPKGLAEALSLIINYIFKNEFDLLVVSDRDRQYSRNQEAVIKAVQYIKKNYHSKDISLRKVASEVALSHYYFSHVFKDELKITFVDYLTKVRIEAAARLLKNKKLSINQIAYAVGFQDPNYFSKVFKRYMKISPIEYRGHLLKKGAEKQIITV